jgi:HEAT repeat protein
MDRELKKLIRELDDPDEEVRINAIKKLGEKKAVSSVPKLIEALKWGSNPYVDLGARKALIKIGEPAVPALIEKIKGEDSFVRNNAIRVLGEIGDRRAVPVLIEAVKDKTRGRSEAASALMWMGVQNLELNVLVLCKLFCNDKDEILKIGKPAIPVLIELLKDDNSTIRSEAVKALVMLGTHALPALFSAIKDEDSKVCESVVEALGKIRHYFAVPFLIKVLKDGDPYVRKSAAEALGNIGHESAVPALIEALEDSEESVRLDAALALGYVGDVRAAQPLIEKLEDNKDMRTNAAMGLGGILNSCETLQEIQNFETKLQEGYELREKVKGKDEFLKVQITISQLRIAASVKRNELSKDKGILLDDKPKPPKKGTIFRTLNRKRSLRGAGGG